MTRKLPEWVPQVSRPYNHAYREVWDAMTPNDRRWSFVVDVLVVIGIIVLAVGLSHIKV